jgi:hypothetical protein
LELGRLTSISLGEEMPKAIHAPPPAGHGGDRELLEKLSLVQAAEKKRLARMRLTDHIGTRLRHDSKRH